MTYGIIFSDTAVKMKSHSTKEEKLIAREDVRGVCNGCSSAEGCIYSLGSYITLNRRDMRSKFGYTTLADIHLIRG